MSVSVKCGYFEFFSLFMDFGVPPNKRLFFLVSFCVRESYVCIILAKPLDKPSAVLVLKNHTTCLTRQDEARNPAINIL